MYKSPELGIIHTQTLYQLGNIFSNLLLLNNLEYLLILHQLFIFNGKEMCNCLCETSYIIEIISFVLLEHIQNTQMTDDTVIMITSTHKVKLQAWARKILNLHPLRLNTIRRVSWTTRPRGCPYYVYTLPQKYIFTQKKLSYCQEMDSSSISWQEFSLLRDMQMIKITTPTRQG